MTGLDRFVHPLASDARNAVDLFRRRVARHPEAPALRTFPGDDVWSWEEWARSSEGVARRLQAEGVKPGDRVAIWAGNQPIWPIADLGALMAGAVPVGLYPSSAPVQVRTLLSDAEVVLALVDSAERAEVLRELGPQLPALAGILDGRDLAMARQSTPSSAPGHGGPRETDPGTGGRAPVAGEWPGEGRGLDDDALLIYTSGSTGEPKGARISHRYLLASASSSREALGLREGDLTLSFLPYCHAAERVFGLYTRILAGIETVLVENHRLIWEAARTWNPTVFGGLPRFFEKVVEGIQAHVPSGGDPRALLPDYFGHRLRVATSGGAALSREVSEELAGLGVKVLGAYGLTEHLCATMNRPDRQRLESAGLPMPGTELRIAGDGEILLRRGPLTFSGYLNRPDETRRSFTPDGKWLLTGDLGRVDDDGFLFVTGRKKELLALSTGKKVAPAPIERRLERHPWFEQVVLVGEGRKFISALLVLNRSEVERWAVSEGIDTDWEGLRHHPLVASRVDEVIGMVNRDLSRTEQVKRYHLLAAGLSQEAGELTPTHKVRRAAVVDHYAEAIEAMYTAAPTTVPGDSDRGTSQGLDP